MDTLSEVLRDAANRVTAVNKMNGWFDADRTFGDEIALIHSEVSEALEEFRDRGTDRGYEERIETWGDVDIHGDTAFMVKRFSPLAEDEPYPEGMKPLGVPSEAADILVRLLDFCSRYDIDLGAEFEAKLEYNATRGHRHGGKSL